MSRHVIHISKKLLAFRGDAIKIKKESENSSSDIIIIDFSEVHFISRAFADEFLKISEKLQKNGVKIQLSNIKPNLKKLFQTVRSTRKRIKRELSAQE